jgi:ATP-dependent Lon protease
VLPLDVTLSEGSGAVLALGGMGPLAAEACEIATTVVSLNLGRFKGWLGRPPSLHGHKSGPLLSKRQNLHFIVPDPHIPKDGYSANSAKALGALGVAAKCLAGRLRGRVAVVGGLDLRGRVWGMADVVEKIRQAKDAGVGRRGGSQGHWCDVTAERALPCVCWRRWRW